MFIGDRQIKLVINIEGDENNVNVMFEKNHPEIKINKSLLEKIQTKEKGVGNVSDSINHYFATKFLAELAVNDLGFYFANNVGIAMATLAHNLREELLRKTFNCSGGDDISLRTITSLDK